MHGQEEKCIILLNAAEYFQKNRKNVAREKEKHMIYYMYIGTSSRKSKQVGRMYLWFWLITEKANDLVPQTGLIEFYKSTKYMTKS